MLKDLFQKQQENLNYFFHEIDLTQAEIFLNFLAACKGMLFFCGVGKSGLIAKKIETTLTSIGIKAGSISPVEALHGDIGAIGEGDIVVFLSKSGESDELLHLIPFLRNKGAEILSLVCDKGSRLTKASDYSFILPFKGELCPFGLMPTISSETLMLFGDVIVVGLMIKKGVRVEDYRLNHPAGRIGKRLTISVSDLMLTGEALPFCGPEAKILDELVQLSNKQCGCLIIGDTEKNIRGIFTDGDLRRALQLYGSNALSKTFEEIMTKIPRSISSKTLAIDALRKMEENQKSPITVLPVVDEGKVVGLIKMHDILQAGV